MLLYYNHLHQQKRRYQKMFNEAFETPVQGKFDTIDPMIFAQLQQMAQMLGSAGSQMMLQQQGQAQVAQSVGQDQVAASRGM